MTCGSPALITDFTIYFGESLHNANLLMISEDNLFDKKCDAHDASSFLPTKFYVTKEQNCWTLHKSQCLHPSRILIIYQGTFQDPENVVPSYQKQLQYIISSNSACYECYKNFHVFQQEKCIDSNILKLCHDKH